MDINAIKQNIKTITEQFAKAYKEGSIFELAFSQHPSKEAIRRILQDMHIDTMNVARQHLNKDDLRKEVAKYALVLEQIKHAFKQAHGYIERQLDGLEIDLGGETNAVAKLIQEVFKGPKGIMRAEAELGLKTAYA